MTSETMQFKTELKQILRIIIHSLYSHKDIFLRELISNASDAIDRLRFEALTRHELLGGDDNWKIKITADEQAGTLTVSDNGIGMARDTIVENLGTIARSGTRAFLESLQSAEVQQRPELIGQFGVGFYSSFMVADKVTVRSRFAGAAADEAVQWESDGEGEFTVASINKETRGTDVILHLRPDDREFLKAWTVRGIVKKYSDFVEHPIVMDVEREDENKVKSTVEETLNSRKALWLRPKSAVQQEEYDEFYRHISHDHGKPARTIHLSAEGTMEFKALLFIPEHKPFDLIWDNTHKGLQLYIQRVFIMDRCEALLPPYLRFVRGVVDSADLPLNVSRETLQHSPLLEKIKSNLVNKVLRTLDEMRSKEPEAYLKFYQEMGTILKEGIVQDGRNREQIAELLLLPSSKTEPGKFTTLAQYVESMPVSQKEIWYLTGESRMAVEHSPHLESFKAQGQEVLFMVEPIDEFMMQSLTEYKDKTFKAINKGKLDGAPVDESKQQQFQPLLDWMKSKLGEVKEVRLSSRLKESAACLVTGEHDMGAHMEQMLRRFGREAEIPPAQPTLELNPDHPAVQAVLTLFTAHKDEPSVEKFAHLLYDQAVIAEGAKVKDPSAFAQRLNELLVKAATM
jgi:molecular chaperone HtpG